MEHVKKIVTIVGSSRFCDVAAVCGWLLEREEGVVTTGMHLLPHWYNNPAEHHVAESEGVEEKIGRVFEGKIMIADEVFVVDWDGYIGDNTRRFIKLAEERGIPIRYLGQDSIRELVYNAIKPGTRVVGTCILPEASPKRSNRYPEEFECPRRLENGQTKDSPLVYTGPDYWGKNDTCSYCGSLHPNEFLESAKDGRYSLGPTDKDYKVYLDGGEDIRLKFCFQHLSEEQCREFVRLLNEKKFNIGDPGKFYVLPFFLEVK